MEEVVAAQSSAAPWSARQKQKADRQPSQLGRAIRYLGNYKQLTAWAYLSLIISIGAQLMVPQMVQNIMDAVTRGLVASQVATMPANLVPAVLAKVDMTADEALAIENSGRSKRGPEPQALNAAIEWLRELLNDQKPHLTKDIRQSAKDANIRWGNVERASVALEVSKSRAGFGGGSSWQLPNPASAGKAQKLEVNDTNGELLEKRTYSSRDPGQINQSRQVSEPGANGHGSGDIGTSVS